MADAPPDTGLQAERTELAWRRTQISLVVIACLALRDHHPTVSLLALGTAGVLWLRQGRRYQHSLAMLRDECGRARLHTVLGISLMLVAIAVMAALDALGR